MTASASRPLVGRVTAAQVFHALSDETRLAVLDMLRGGERCVCDLQAALDAAQSRLSFHLKVLKDAGLVTDRRDGRWSYYALNADRLAEAGTVLDGFVNPPAQARSLELHSLARAPRAASVARRATAGKSAVKDGCC
jgi:ArsR family transcriptional regulator